MLIVNPSGSLVVNMTLDALKGMAIDLIRRFSRKSHFYKKANKSYHMLIGGCSPLYYVISGDRVSIEI